MSGGSLDYACFKVEEAASAIRCRAAATPLHRAFAAHLELVARALHDIEWVYSGDYGAGQEVGAVEACLPPNADLSVLLDDAIALHEALSQKIAAIRRQRPRSATCAR